MVAKRELFKSVDVCELTQLQPYVLRSWEAEFPGLGKPAAGGGRVYRRADVELVLRIKDLVFVEGLTLAGARRRLEEEQQEPSRSIAAVAMDDVLSAMARTKLREVRTGLEAILQLLSHDAGRPPELQLVAPAARSKGPAAKRRRAS
ncbi:MAG TPA: MerR family transcriptional regulator [Vicinamibacterales bacterium]|nr:MerR family transcriptional regulator [Vicinamibacterales bacterium]